MNSKLPKERSKIKYIANFDYEQCIAHGTKPSLNVVKQWDWAVLWIEGCSYDLDWYSKEYLDLVAKYREVFHLSESSKEAFWWGEFQNAEREKEFNSKLLALKCKNELKINFLSEEVFSDGKEYSGNHYLRENLNFAGKGSQIFSRKPKNLNRSKTYLVAPYIRERVDFSTWSNGIDNFQYKNIVSQNGQYIGTNISENDFDELDLLKVDEIDQKIRQWYVNTGANNSFGIDYFIHEEQIIFCEVNYRKTMGYIANKLKAIIAPDSKEFRFSTQPSNEAESMLISSSYCPIKWYISHS